MLGTAGMLLSSQFNINYFAISEVDQWFPDFAVEWEHAGTPQTLHYCLKTYFLCRFPDANMLKLRDDVTFLTVGPVLPQP
jgi:hypothetical protein